MEEAPENGKESLHSAHAKGINILLSEGSVAPCCYGDGSVSLDVTSEQRLLVEALWKETPVVVVMLECVWVI